MYKKRLALPARGVASGLPVVVSDWDGYKETVADNVGIKVPTVMAPEDWVATS